MIYVWQGFILYVAGVTILQGEDRQGATAYLLGEVVAPAGLLTIAVVIGIHLMPMGM